MRLQRYAPSDSSTYLKYASGVLGRKLCIHIRLHLLATNSCEKCGLRNQQICPACPLRGTEKASAISAIKHGLFVAHKNRYSAQTSSSAPVEFLHQATLIRRLRQSRPEGCRDCSRRIDITMSNFFPIHPRKTEKQISQNARISEAVLSESSINI